ncbi:hypothetical protein BsWGS_21199 [Bradybaena similaris]
MRTYNNASCHASVGDGAERCQQTGIQMCCADQLTVAAGSFDATMLSCRPDSAMQAADSACNWDAVSIWNNIDELNSNCNHNVRYEPLPNEGCGCTGSYNGGAGAGTAVCCGNSGQSIYHHSHFGPHHGHDSGCADSSHVPPKKHCCPFDANNYHRPSFGTPQCMDHYVPEIGSGYMGNPCTSSSECPDTYELIRNTDAQRYKGIGPDRSHYFSDDCFQGCR